VDRNDGERRLVEAALELAREQPFGDWSAREIARRANLNQSYVHVWFGSKAGLLDAAYQRQIEVLRARLAEGPFRISVDLVHDPEVELVFRLLARLQNEPGGIELAQRRQRPILSLMAAYMQSATGMTADRAHIAASLAVAAVAGAVTVGRVLDLEVAATLAVWPKILAALSDHETGVPPARSAGTRRRGAADPRPSPDDAPD
jgi:AcrR family transcriptional regulator